MTRVAATLYSVGLCIVGWAFWFAELTRRVALDVHRDLTALDRTRDRMERDFAEVQRLLAVAKACTEQGGNESA